MDNRTYLVAYNLWLALTPDVRHKLSTLFDVPKTGRTVVEYRAGGAVVTSDGYTPTDLYAISMEKMQNLLDTDSMDFYGLFEQVIANIDTLMGANFTSGGSRLPDQESPAPQSVPAKGLPKWPQFVKENKGDGRTMTDIAALYKQLKEEQGHANN